MDAAESEALDRAFRVLGDATRRQLWTVLGGHPGATTAELTAAIPRLARGAETARAFDSKTSWVTSRPSGMPVASIISLPTTVLASWKAGRQCMNLTSG